MDLNERRYAETETAPVATGKRNPRVKSSPLAAAQNIGPLVSLLDRAVVLVPRVALAWGIVGIAAAAAIVNVILGLNKLALASGFFVFVGMVILFAFAQIPARDRVTRLAGQSLVAAVALATVIFIGSSLWAAMFCAPPGFVYLYGLDGVCRSQPSLPPKTPDPQPKVTEAQPRAVEAQPKISEIASFEYNDKFGKVSVEKDHYEGSKADIAEDKRQAKKRGMSMKEWEASPEDRAMDAAGGGISADYTIATLESSFQKRQRSVRTGGTVGLPILRVKCFRRTQARLYEWLAATGPGPRL